jgi:hypothetical protein
MMTRMFAQDSFVSPLAVCGAVGISGRFSRTSSQVCVHVRAEVNKATGDVLGEILQARFNHRIIGTDLPGYPLSLFIDLS